MLRRLDPDLQLKEVTRSSGPLLLTLYCTSTAATSTMTTTTTGTTLVFASEQQQRMLEILLLLTHSTRQGKAANGGQSQSAPSAPSAPRHGQRNYLLLRRNHISNVALPIYTGSGVWR